MALVLVLHLEHNGEMAVREIWQALADAGVSSLDEKPFDPHITLGVVHDAQQEAFAVAVEAIAREMPPMPILMSHYGMFTTPGNILFLGVVQTDSLHNLHRTLYRECAAMLDQTILFAPPTWVPHCTLAHNVATENLTTALVTCRRFPLPLMTAAARITLVDTEGNGVAAAYPIPPA